MIELPMLACGAIARSKDAMANLQSESVVVADNGNLKAALANQIFVLLETGLHVHDEPSMKTCTQEHQGQMLRKTVAT